MRRKKELTFHRFVFSLLFFTSIIYGQQDLEIDKWMNLELEELGKIRLVSVSIGKKNISIRESPGIISLITSDEIENSGARDLIDVLRLVPGFDFGIDVESTIGVGIRGNWAHEGKMMLLVDGQQMNELLYATNQFGNHFPVNQIDRIEIIRGPGSSMYGEFAEFAVVNIVTKSKPGDGTALYADYGRMSDTLARSNLNFHLSQKLGDVNFNLGLFYGKGNRSRLDYTDIYGDSYSMKNNSKLETGYMNLGLTWKQFSTRLIIDRYKYDMRDGFDQINDLALKYAFNSYHFETKGDFQLGSRLKITPRINYSSQYPWNSTDDNSRELDSYYKVRVERLKFSVNVAGDITDKIFINAGVLQYFDRGMILGDTPEEMYFNGEPKVKFSGKAAFLQTFIKTPIVIFTGGLRFDDHKEFGSSLVPWIGINKVYKQWYFKFMYGQTFRVPNIANITLSDEIKPEKSNEFDLEIGYEFKNSMTVSFNFFSTGITDPIVYTIDPETDEEGYANFGKTGTWGFELGYLIKGGWGYVDTTYSYYHARANNLETYKVEDQSGLMLGFPAHKATINSNIRLTSRFSINPSIVYYSKRFAYDSIDEEGEAVLKEFKPTLLGNIFLLYRDILKNIDIGFGVYDIMGEKYRFLQPYDGYHASYPGVTREWMLRIVFRLFNK